MQKKKYISSLGEASPCACGDSLVTLICIPDFIGTLDKRTIFILVEVWQHIQTFVEQDFCFFLLFGNWGTKIEAKPRQMIQDLNYYDSSIVSSILLLDKVSSSCFLDKVLGI